MRHVPTQIGAGLLLAATSSVALAQSPSATAIPVTIDNYNRAESDVYFGLNVKRGGFGKFLHTRETVPVDKQGVIRPNRDTLYSAAVLDLDAGPVTVTLPDAGKRFMSMQVIGSLRAGGRLRRLPYLHKRKDRNALRDAGHPDADRPQRSQGRRTGPSLAGRDQDRPGGRPRPFRSTQLGFGEPEESTGCAAGARRDPPRYEAHVRQPK